MAMVKVAALVKMAVNESKTHVMDEAKLDNILEGYRIKLLVESPTQLKEFYAEFIKESQDVSVTLANQARLLAAVQKSKAK